MDASKKAAEIAKEIRETLTSGEIPSVVPTNRQGGDLKPTAEEIWVEVEKRLSAKLKHHIEDAYSAGKRDGLEEAKRSRWAS